VNCDGKENIILCEQIRWSTKMSRLVKYAGVLKEGLVLESNNYGTFEVAKYVNSSQVTIKFLKTGFCLVTNSSTARRGNVADKYYPRYWGKGYLGEGEYHQKLHKESYNSWKWMLGRCYNEKSNRYSRYGGRGVVVCKDWLNFQKYSKWYYENLPKSSNIKFNVDKDILKHNNKVYCPEYCCMIPQRMNAALVTNSSKRGKYPTGVSSSCKKFAAYCRGSTEYPQGYLGCFATVEDAFSAYKEEKRRVLKGLAEEYYGLGVISEKIRKIYSEYPILEFPE